MGAIAIPQLLKASDCAGPLGCSTKQVRRLIDQGKLKAIRLGRGARSDRIHPDDLLDYINQERRTRAACQLRDAVTRGKLQSTGEVRAIVDLLDTGPALRRVK